MVRFGVAGFTFDGGTKESWLNDTSQGGFEAALCR
jgi:hypothetical protein